MAPVDCALWARARETIHIYGGTRASSRARCSFALLKLQAGERLRTIEWHISDLMESWELLRNIEWHTSDLLKTWERLRTTEWHISDLLKSWERLRTIEWHTSDLLKSWERLRTMEWHVSDLLKRWDQALRETCDVGPYDICLTSNW
jgi:hypothetical protein